MTHRLSLETIMPAPPAFSDPAIVAQYADATPRRVPGFVDLHRMALLLLGEAAPDAARILLLGAGGGLELKAFAQARPGWSLVGVDPSQAMLDLAREVVGPAGARVDLVRGYIDDAPSGPFDGAACLLTLHFLERPERLATLRALHRRLRPGAPLVVAHHACPEAGKVELWLQRSVAFADRAGTDGAQAAASAAAMARQLPLLTPAQEEALLAEAGFSGAALFYAGFTFRGWVAAA